MNATSEQSYQHSHENEINNDNCSSSTVIKQEDTKIKQLEDENNILRNEILKFKKQLDITKHDSSWLFRDIVEHKTGHKIIKATPELLEECKTIASKAYDFFVDTHENNVLPCKRINEAGNYMETMFDKLDDNRIIKPINSFGNMKATGYPDRELIDTAYLEIKLIEEGSEQSTLRSFYISTLDKITKSQPHILIAFTHKNKIISKEKPKIVDLYDIKLKVKVEYNTNNKTLYS